MPPKKKTHKPQKPKKTHKPKKPQKPKKTQRKYHLTKRMSKAKYQSLISQNKKDHLQLPKSLVYEENSL